jgi:hypothetical protein
MKLDQATIDRCERLYKSKAEAHFCGLWWGMMFGALIALIVIIGVSIWHITH